MMSPTARFGLIFCGVLLQAACTSTQIRYHSLMPTDPRSIAPTNVALIPLAFSFEVLPIGIPAQVDRQEIVVRQDNELLILEGERWAATLGDEMRETLSVLLQRKLGIRDISGLGSATHAPVLRVKVMVRQFESVSSQYALIDADWNLSRADKPDMARLLCHSPLQVRAPGSYRELVAAQQGLVDALATQIASAARTWMVSGGNACPRNMPLDLGPSDKQTPVPQL